MPFPFRIKVPVLDWLPPIAFLMILGAPLGWYPVFKGKSRQRKPKRRVRKPSKCFQLETELSRANADFRVCAYYGYVFTLIIKAKIARNEPCLPATRLLKTDGEKEKVPRWSARF